MRFNILRRKERVVKNHEGATAWRLSPEMELYSSVVTASLQDQFYETAGAKVDRIRGLISKNDPVFVAKLAVYTREKMYLRSVPLVLAVELAKTHTGDGLVSKTVSRVVQRADEITELLSYYTLANNRVEVKKLNKLSKQVQKGLAQAFNKFDEYQFAKYNRSTAIKLKDALFIVHPKAKDEAQQVLFDKIVKDELETPYTWETELSATGQMKYKEEKEKRKAVKATWEELIDSGRMGYMAMLRNLCNILEYGVSPAHIQKVCALLTNEKAVLQSKQLPFRFLSAYREVNKLSEKVEQKVEIKAALEKALKVSVQNLMGFDANTRVVIASDVSGSMYKLLSPKSTVQCYDIGLLLSMLLKHKCRQVTTGIFGDDWKIIELPENNILENVMALYSREGEVGYSTNGYKVLEDLISRKQVADKIMFFTDMQLWNSTGGNTSLSAQWKLYKKIAPHAKLYIFDLAGYGQAPVNMLQDDVYLISGWSDKVFEVMEAIEQGSSAIAEINAINL